MEFAQGSKVSPWAFQVHNRTHDAKLIIFPLSMQAKTILYPYMADDTSSLQIL